MKYLLTGNEMAAADRITSEKIGIPSIVLMERAALAAADEITERFAGIKRVTIVSGPGNNGADGLAVGRILIDRGCRVQFFVLSEKDPPAGSSMEVQRKILRAYGAVPEVFDEERLKRFAPEIIVDALFGTGLARELSGTAKQVVCAVNEYRMQNGCKAVAVDIPSGISSETGAVMGCAMTCDLTVTFAYYKRGHFLYPGCSYCGETVLRQIGIHDRSFAAEERPLPEMFMNEYADIARRIAYRDPGGHKGTFGKILIIAGSYAMCGAALLCARAALKSGAGMVKIFTREENRVIIQQAFPEAMLTTYEALPEDGELRKAAQKKIVQALKADIQWADAVAAGPGIGRGSEAALLVNTVLEAAGNDNTGLMESGNAISMLVLDADALFMIASDAAMERQLADHAEKTAVVLTPHLAEFAYLAHVSAYSAAADRIQLMRDIADKYRCTIIGKDARTLIMSHGVREICMITNGNSGMATAGSGDVLTGITAAMLCTVRERTGCGQKAAECAAFIHAQAGSSCMEKLGKRAMLAGDILAETGRVLHEMEL